MKKRTTVLILGAAGRDFHNFNVYFRNNKAYNVVGFTATQIPKIEGRIYPPALAGKLYPKGIPIYDEGRMEELIREHDVRQVYFSYSDVSHEYVMHLASRAQAAGASFVLLGPKETMLKSSRKVIAVCAARTGSGKSPLTRRISEILKATGKKFVVVRHPMPYGELERQAVQRFSTIEDLDRYKCTIEEQEEYEPHIKNGIVVYAGIDYARILKKAENEADIIVWDGGNNDYPFYKPDILFVVADSLRAGHELKYYPGETNFRMADVIVINKKSENPDGAALIAEAAGKTNPRATTLHADLKLAADEQIDIAGRKVLVIEDGPTTTHGGMAFGAGYKYAKQCDAVLVDPRKCATGSIKKAFEEYRHLREVIPALGYYGGQLRDLEESIKRSGAEVVVSATPVNLKRILSIPIPILHITYKIEEEAIGSIEGSLRKNGII